MVAETSATPENLEPEKCFGWDWYIWGPESLPTPLFSSLVVALDTGFDPLAVEQSSQMQPGTESGAAGRVTKRSRQS